MTLEELQQVKADVDNGIMVSKGTWLKVLEQAVSDRKVVSGIMANAKLNTSIAYPYPDNTNVSQVYPRGMEPSAYPFPDQSWLGDTFRRIFG